MTTPILEYPNAHSAITDMATIREFEKLPGWTLTVESSAETPDKFVLVARLGALVRAYRTVAGNWRVRFNGTMLSYHIPDLETDALTELPSIITQAIQQLKHDLVDEAAAIGYELRIGKMRDKKEEVHV